METDTHQMEEVFFVQEDFQYVVKSYPQQPRNISSFMQSKRQRFANFTGMRNMTLISLEVTEIPSPPPTPPPTPPPMDDDEPPCDNPDEYIPVDETTINSNIDDAGDNEEDDEVLPDWFNVDIGNSYKQKLSEVLSTANPTSLGLAHICLLHEVSSEFFVDLHRLLQSSFFNKNDLFLNPKKTFDEMKRAKSDLLPTKRVIPLTLESGENVEMVNPTDILLNEFANPLKVNHIQNTQATKPPNGVITKPDHTDYIHEIPFFADQYERLHTR